MKPCVVCENKNQPVGRMRRTTRPEGHELIEFFWPVCEKHMENTHLYVTHIVKPEEEPSGD